MKKIFALALAAVMTAGMTTVAFADTTADVNLAKDTKTSMFVDASDDGHFDSEDKEGRFDVQAGTSVTFSKPDGGKKVALPLYNKAGAAIDEKDDIKGYKVKAEWKVGELAEKPEIELVKIDGKYIYAVTFTLPEAADTKALDLAGEISVYKNSSDLKDTNANKKYITVKVGGDYGYEEKELSKWDDLQDAEIVIFKEAGKGLEGEETLTFGDLFEFEVDVTGQGNLNLKNNVDFNKEFAAMYDYANIDFITFEKEPTFNKNGTVYIYADEDEFVYEVTADGAKAIKGLKWDEDYEAWTFKTRTLKSYAISDVELDEKTVTEDKNESSKPAGDKENPDTGR